MSDLEIKNILSYVLAPYLHEDLRNCYKREDGSFESKIKISTDLEWNLEHGTNQVDIMNCSFLELPSNWKRENYEAASFVILLVYDKMVSKEIILSDDIEDMASAVHEEWLRRNSWVYDLNHGDSNLALSYEELSMKEKEKDKRQILLAQKLVQDYLDGFLNLDDIRDTCKVTFQ